MNFARFGFIMVIIVIQIPAVRGLLALMVDDTLSLIGRLFGLPL